MTKGEGVSMPKNQSTDTYCSVQSFLQNITR